MRKEAAGAKTSRLEAESQWCGSHRRTSMAFPLLLVGRDAIETVMAPTMSIAKSASIYDAIADPGFRLSPSCSPIRFGLVFPRGSFFTRIVHDKGRNHSFRGAFPQRGEYAPHFPECDFGTTSSGST